MRNGFLSTLTVLLAGTGLAVAQAPVSIPATTTQCPLACDKPATCCVEPVCPCPCPEVCGPAGRVWVTGEYLLWWIKDSNIPPLVTTSPPASLGVIGAPGTSVLLGGSDLNTGPYSGARITAGAWLNEAQTFGLEASYFFLGARSSNFAIAGSAAPGSPIIARPFFNVVTGAQDAEIASFPGVITGSVNASNSSRLQGAGANMIANLCCACNYRVDMLLGFSYLNLDEDLQILENANVAPGVATFGGSRVGVADTFSTANRFYGGLLGARSEYRVGRAFANVLGTVALGSTHEVVRVFGATSVTSPAGVTTLLPGGLLALPTNGDSFSRNAFAVVPQVGMNVGYQLTDNLRAFVGYSFLYWSNVVRPGDQIDTGLNRTQIPTSLTGGALVGPARPAVLFRDTDFWAHGVNFGLGLLF